MSNAQEIIKQNADKKWLLGEIHPVYGEVKACGVSDGSPWRM